MKTKAAPKDRLFQTAARLFYRQGYRAVGVDTLAAESGIGKMTLYRHYPSKEALIVAFLEDSNEVFWNNFEALTQAEPTPRGKLLAFFGALQEYAVTPACHGCPFLNVATEYPEISDAGHRVALEHKKAVRARFEQLAREVGVDQSVVLADALVLLMDGAYMAARMFGSSSANPAATVAATARQLIDAHCLD